MTSVTSVGSRMGARAGSLLIVGVLATACSDGSGGGTGGDATGGGGASSSSATTDATTSAGTTSATGGGGGGAGGAPRGEGGAGGDCLSNDDCIASQYCTHGWSSPVCISEGIGSWCVDRAEACDPGSGPPVCGCDGTVHASPCEASMAGVALDSSNACDAPAGSFDCRQTFCDAGAVCVIKRDGDDVTPRCEPLPEACGAAASCGCITGVDGDGTDCACEGEGCACEEALAAFCYGGLVDVCLGDGRDGFTLDCNPEP